MISEDEQSLILQIIQDNKKSCGNCTRETKKIIDQAIDYYLTNEVSDNFEMALENYRHNLSANIEDIDSQRYSQSIYAACKRKEGIYFLEDAWGKLLKTWIKKHQTNISLVAALDDLYRIVPKTKLTKMWLENVDAVFEKYTEVTILELLRSWIECFINSKVIAKKGLCYDNESKLKAMVLILTRNKHERDCLLLRKLAVLSCKKIPRAGPISTVVGNVCIQALSEQESIQGLVQLNELVDQINYPANIAAFAKKRLDVTAKKKGIKLKDLQNIVVPGDMLND